MADNVDGIVIDHQVLIGNPADAPLLVPAITRIKTRFRTAPRAVTADRGYGEAALDAAVGDLGVKYVAIPRRGKPGVERTRVQRAPRFVRLVKWRTGSEAKISCLKRDYLWRRTLFDGLAGAETWCGWGVLAHNAIKISTLAAVEAISDDGNRQRPPRARHGSDPPTKAFGIPISA